jgi:hypothetical protein
LRSPPAENDLGILLRITITLISELSSRNNNAKIIYFIISVVIVFKLLGEFRSICPIEPIVSTKMFFDPLI